MSALSVGEKKNLLHTIAINLDDSPPLPLIRRAQQDRIEIN